MVKKFKIGDVVSTDFSGKVTRHKITEIKYGQISQTKICFKVLPAVPGSSGLNALIDSAWFEYERF